MRKRSLIQKIISEGVAATSEIKVANRLYGSIYEKACEVFADHCNSMGNLFLRGSMARGDSQPGVSDIDVAIITPRSELSVDEVISIWKRFSQLTAIFPMFESLLLLSQSGHQLWTGYGDYRAFERPLWKAMTSMKQGYSRYSATRLKFQLDLLFEIFCQYLTLCSASQKASLRARKIEHRSKKKILTLINTARGGASGEVSANGMGVKQMVAAIDALCCDLLMIIPKELRERSWGDFSSCRLSNGQKVMVSTNAIAGTLTFLVDQEPIARARLSEASRKVCPGESRRYVFLTEAMEKAFRAFWPRNVIHYFLARPDTESELLLKEALCRKLTNLPLLLSTNGLGTYSVHYAMTSSLRLVAAKKWKTDAVSDEALERLFPSVLRGHSSRLRKRGNDLEKQSFLKDRFVFLQKSIHECLQS